LRGGKLECDRKSGRTTYEYSYMDRSESATAGDKTKDGAGGPVLCANGYRIAASAWVKGV
jgi:hypothetical protein